LEVIDGGGQGLDELVQIGCGWFSHGWWYGSGWGVDGEAGVGGVVVDRWGGGGTSEDEERLEADIRLSRASMLKVADPWLRSSKLRLVKALSFSPGRPIVKGMR
jgi:hypothetical protein